MGQTSRRQHFRKNPAFFFAGLLICLPSWSLDTNTQQILFAWDSIWTWLNLGFSARAKKSVLRKFDKHDLHQLSLDIDWVCIPQYDYCPYSGQCNLIAICYSETQLPRKSSHKIKCQFISHSLSKYLRTEMWGIVNSTWCCPYHQDPSRQKSQGIQRHCFLSRWAKRPLPKHNLLRKKCLWMPWDFWRDGSCHVPHGNGHADICQTLIVQVMNNHIIRIVPHVNLN